MPLKTAEDLAAFFDPEDFADECVITGPNAFTRTLNVILNTGTEPVTLYETNVEAPNPSFMCREDELVDVKRGMTATVRGKAYKIERIAFDQADTATVYLSE